MGIYKGIIGGKCEGMGIMVVVVVVVHICIDTVRGRA